MILRTNLHKLIKNYFSDNPVVALLGPRQCGKTTAARVFAEQQIGTTFLDLENPRDLALLQNPMLALERLRGIIVIDEFQRLPELFPILRVLADRPDTPARFLILGSASMSLIKGVSETLAGRAVFIDMSGFNLTEAGPEQLEKLWIRGGFPRSYLAQSDQASFLWREHFIRALLERDIPQLGITVPTPTLRRFWNMVCHYHGQIWNAAEFARALGTTEANARKYLDIICGSYGARQIHPWFENISKRQVKAPKIYIRDSGILHSLLECRTHTELLNHPKAGASWEGFIIEQILSYADSRQVYFWATHSGAELDLLLIHRGEKYGFEIKLSDSPHSTKSMHSAIESLQLKKMFVVYPGKNRFDIQEKIEVIPAEKIPEIITDIYS